MDEGTFRDLVVSFVRETIDYAQVNNLGDPEQQHNVKWARKLGITREETCPDASYVFNKPLFGDTLCYNGEEWRVSCRDGVHYYVPKAIQKEKDKP